MCAPLFYPHLLKEYTQHVIATILLVIPGPSPWSLTSFEKGSLKTMTSLKFRSWTPLLVNVAWPGYLDGHASFALAVASLSLHV
jgi:hypothetical protein